MAPILPWSIHSVTHTLRGPDLCFAQKASPPHAHVFAGGARRSPAAVLVQPFRGRVLLCASSRGNTSADSSVAYGHSRLGFGLQGNSTDRNSPEAVVPDRRCRGDVLLFFCHSRTNFISLSLCPAMKVLPTIALGLVVLIAAVFLLGSSLCAARNDIFDTGGRIAAGLDVDYYRPCREVFIKPPEMPLVYDTPVKWGCPYDCGLCSDHEQHSCLTLVEICDYCNLRCPVCYAASGPERQQFRDLKQIEKMLDAVVRNEGHPDVVQLSGGEPTMHPDFFAIVEMAKARPIRHLMVNTNGVRIAQEEDFVARLAEYKEDFEIYLQFDSFEREPLMQLRGADLRRIRRDALERLNRHNISTNLVVTLKKGLNDHEIGKTIDFALEQSCVRGVTFQPIQDAGRLEDFDPAM